MQTHRYLYRREASDYLLTTHGLELSGEQLARLAVAGGGPRFRLLAGRAGKAVYTQPDLDIWARAYLGPAIARISEHPAHRSDPHNGSCMSDVRTLA
jgi:hypothetical protein